MLVINVNLSTFVKSGLLLLHIFVISFLRTTILIYEILTTEKLLVQILNQGPISKFSKKIFIK